VTLAVAACFPWGREREIADSLPQGSEVARGVVLATDSRFSYENGVRIDVGRKVYVLEPNVALVFAGSVSAAQQAISDIQRFIAKRTPDSQIPMSNIVQQYLQQAYAKAVARRRRRGKREVHPLRFLVGVYDHTTRLPHVLAFSSDSNFAARTGDKVHALGVESNVRNFGEVLFRRNREREDFATDPLDWQFDTVVAVRGALEAHNRSATIGGLVQAVVLDERGVAETTFSFTGGDPMDESSKRPASVQIADTKQDRPSYLGRHGEAVGLTPRRRRISR
jgi:proteasome subunit B (beta)-like protein